MIAVTVVLVFIIYRKIPKISLGVYIFQRPFLSGLFLEGLIFGGAYIRREICVLKLARLILGRKFMSVICTKLLLKLA